jgi:hypothetical protein
VEAQREIVSFLLAYQEIWHRFFPDLHRRGQWHLVSHLCGRARAGAPVGELSGMVKQVFLLDDATVRERLSELYRLGFCAIDPPDRSVSARTLVVPSPLLTAKFDAHLIDAAARLMHSPLAGIGARRAPPTQIDPETRRKLLGAIEACDHAWVAALERVLESMGLSVARRLEARRHLLSPSHRLLALLALSHHYGLPPQDGADGMLADDMAAELLRLQRQNFQTTRDHIAALLQLNLLERRPGRALRVSLVRSAAEELDATLSQGAESITRAGTILSGGTTDLEGTGLSTSTTRLPAARVLVVTRPGLPEQRVPLGEEPIVVGRAASSGLMLAAHDVSRAHCRIAVSGSAVSIADLDSTNGTFVDGARIAGIVQLSQDAVVRVGPFQLRWQPAVDPDRTMAGVATTESTGRRGQAR